jgi:hypothetical protein
MNLESNKVTLVAVGCAFWAGWKAGEHTEKVRGKARLYAVASACGAIGFCVGMALGVVL